MQNSESLKYFSMFSGIGGFELGIGEYGECVGYSEIDKHAIQIYEKHFPNHKNYGDATKIDAKELPDFDLLVGGFPCQAFSIAGKRGGLKDARGTLFYDIARIAKEKRPQHLLLENVKGLLSNDNGRTFKLIISTFAELGYNMEWQVLNSKNFGVPQNRERVFIIGHLGRCCGRQVFPLGHNGGEYNEVERQQTQITGIINSSMSKGGNKQDSKANVLIRQLNQPTHSNNRIYGVDGLSPALNTMQGGNRQPFIKIPEATKSGYAEATVGQAINLAVPNSKTRRGRVGDLAKTLDTGMQQYTLTPEIRIRRLTPTECERLQGFPDGWTGGVSDTQRYKCLGNAVTVNVIEYLIKQMYAK